MDHTAGRIEPLAYEATRQPGVRLSDAGIDVVVEADHATLVEFCAFDQVGTENQNETRYPLFGPEAGVWHAHIPGIGQGQRYGLRVHGPWDPSAGHLHNPAKLLLDPYAKLVEGMPQLTGALHSHVVDANLGPVFDPWRADPRDSAPVMAFGVVGEADYDWAGSQRPNVSWSQMVVYEAHVRGLTKNHPDVPEPLRGTYAGVAAPAMIEHLQRLGVTSIELLPIHYSMSEPHLATKGLANYWGYSTLNYFAPHPLYATAAAQAAGPEAVVREVKDMVRCLHQAGIEVILDVVYNHTCEVGLGGPTVSWRGLDNLAWYLHDGSVPARYADVTGTGNALDFRRSKTVALALDSLRHWANDYQIDGFRYDLAVTMARGYSGFDPDHPFLVTLITDPVLRGLKHIAEPWDMGPGGWQTGNFPPPIASWNDSFRGDVRSFWLAGPKELAASRPAGNARDLATRLSGSADLFAHANPMAHHGPAGSINFVAAHDGFTLHDLTAYEHKLNQANGEDGRDGTDDNRSWNHGLEGPLDARHDDPTGLGLGSDAILSLRLRSTRNLLAMLAFSAGAPMLVAGDEFGRTQFGNNNAYCQDNDISWINWDLQPWQLNQLDTASFLFQLRRLNPALRPATHLTGRDTGTGLADLSWYTMDGEVVSHDRWHQDDFRAVQMLRHVPDAATRDALVLINGQLESTDAVLPAGQESRRWELIWDSTWDHPGDRDSATQAEGPDVVTPRHDTVPVNPLSTRLYLSI
ncbi:MAG: glycogen debranching protein GlgX [Micrococcales bacterium]|nr:glycogen debranching protein GlgX [Micrococcales bacterium]